jgi:hypothetical protein
MFNTTAVMPLACCMSSASAARSPSAVLIAQDFTNQRRDALLVLSIEALVKLLNA